MGWWWEILYLCMTDPWSLSRRRGFCAVLVWGRGGVVCCVSFFCGVPPVGVVSCSGWWVRGLLCKGGLGLLVGVWCGVGGGKL